jgi:hypothetical protein
MTPAASLWFLLAGGALFAGERIDYLRDVKPILAARCYACHGALKQRSGLRLDTAALIRKGGDDGPAVEPGKSGESLLVERITGNNGVRRMPPESEGEPLKEQEIARIRAWIDEGAAAPPDEKPEADPREHWAFRAPVRPSLPPVKNAAWISTPVDAFIAAEQEKHGLTPQPPADRPLLLRRVYLDLIGLPPTREELAAFVADTSPEAYEKVVERLLASKQYGARWGRHWMDVWRYSDWWGLGAEVRNSQKHIWHWRDWIIESLNADKGYDQMVREMLAADELYPDDLDRLRANGFLARNYFIFNRNTWLDDTIEHTSKAFLGLTLNCARCHDHKYDPLAQADYYRMRAFFEPYQVRTDELPGELDLTKDGLPRVFDYNLDVPTYLFKRGDDRQPVKDRPLSPGVPALLSFGDVEIKPVTLPAEAHAPGLRSFVLEDHLRAAELQIVAARKALQQASKALAVAEEASKHAAPTPTAPGKEGKPLLKDDFAAARPELWETAAGKWKYEGGKLTQQQDGDVRGVLRAKQAPPADFEARFKFTITGGKQWKSVGVTFDVAGNKENLVYLSAYAGGPKVQITYKQDGNHVYPGEAMKALPVKLNEAQELLVRVRGQLVNVAVNGEHALAYNLPQPRNEGRLELITFDAQAEFTAFQLAALPGDVPLVAAGAPAAVTAPKPLTPEQARAAVALAEKALATAEAEPVVLRARAAADRARWQQPPAADALELAKQAARAEKQLALLRAEEAAARAEAEPAAADGAKKAEAEKKLAAAREAVNQARKALEAPGEQHTPLRGSLKTPENNLETEASRNKPFPTTSTGRRSALARWITDPHNPLAARVAVNHIWARHFGRPLVATVFDFGRKGAAPTHPALLDYLAVELRENGWSMKHLHLLIVLSSTYRLASSSVGAPAANVSADPEDRWYWRRPSLRMEAEVVRDSLLSLGGDLDPALGGPPLPLSLEETSRRRSLYFVHSHNDHHKFLTTFDNASVLECYRRSESIVPQQALALSNSKLALGTAEKVAARLGRELGAASDAQFIRAAFETVLAGTPTAAEQAECEQALTRLQELLRQQQQPDPAARARVTLVHALLNHNDFITIR